MNQQSLLTLYRAMYTARQIDKVEQELTQRGDAFFNCLLYTSDAADEN